MLECRKKCGQQAEYRRDLMRRRKKKLLGFLWPCPPSSIILLTSLPIPMILQGRVSSGLIENHPVLNGKVIEMK